MRTRFFFLRDKLKNIIPFATLFQNIAVFGYLNGDSMNGGPLYAF